MLFCTRCRCLKPPPSEPQGLAKFYDHNQHAFIRKGRCPDCAGQTELGAPTPPSTEEMFSYLDEVAAELPDYVQQYVSSIHGQLERGRELSEAQDTLIRKTYFNARRRRGHYVPRMPSL